MRARIKVLVRPDWCEPGQMFVLDARAAFIDYIPEPILRFEHDLMTPEKWIIVHDEEARERFVEAINDSEEMELVP